MQRLVEGIRLARVLRIPLVLSGGSGAVAPTEAREADAMADTAVKLGFPSHNILIENRSRNTLENAKGVAALLPGKTVILVTSAYHMKRALAMFRKTGLSPIPAPTGYKMRSRPSSAINLIPRASSLDASSMALSEYLSLSWYTLTDAI